jgi:hypothetical protein
VCGDGPEDDTDGPGTGSRNDERDGVLNQASDFGTPHTMLDLGFAVINLFMANVPS